MGRLRRALLCALGRHPEIVAASFDTTGNAYLRCRACDRPVMVVPLPDAELLIEQQRYATTIPSNVVQGPWSATVGE